MRQALAKAVYWAGGKLSKIKTPRYTYKLISTEPFVTERSEKRIWVSCEASMKLLKLSMRLAGEHWDHWALRHDRCEPFKCRGCGGLICQDDMTLTLGALKALAKGEPFEDVAMDFGVKIEVVIAAAPLVGREPPINFGFMSLRPEMFE